MTKEEETNLAKKSRSSEADPCAKAASALTSPTTLAASYTTPPILHSIAGDQATMATKTEDKRPHRRRSRHHSNYARYRSSQPLAADLKVAVEKGGAEATYSPKTAQPPPPKRHHWETKPYYLHASGRAPRLPHPPSSKRPAEGERVDGLAGDGARE